MKKTILALLCVLALALTVCVLQPANAAQEYTTLTEAATMEIPEGETLWVDLNGNALTVTGSGTLYAFDSANDGYDAAACGTVINNRTVKIMADVPAPNGNRYIAVTDGGVTTMHRLHVRLTGVSLRTTAAGIYYKAGYDCDDTLSAKVKAYGVVLSINNMPGADFLTETGDINRYTVAAAPFESGVTATSGSVFGIMKAEREAATNAEYGETVIYANPYIRLELDGEKIFVGDVQNAGKVKTDSDFTGKAYSLHDVMDTLDAVYPDCSLAVRKQLDDFYFTWQDMGMDWDFVNIGRSYTSNLNLDENNQAYCPVCKDTVTWTALNVTSQTALEADTHYYLTENLNYTTKNPSFIQAPAAEDKSACLHLNGKNITATKGAAIGANSGILNVMGSGIVTGNIYTGDNNHLYGCAVTMNVTTAGNTINLYSGTYKRHENAPSNAYVLAIRNNGGNLNLYEDVAVEATGDGNAIYINNSRRGTSNLCVYGATVNGNIGVRTKYSGSDFESNLTIDSATVTGTVMLDSTQDAAVLKGKPVIGQLIVPSGFLIQLDDLQDGTDVTVTAEGIFTEENAKAADYAQYFKTELENKCVYAKNNALCCGSSYVADLQLDENNQAHCPVCDIPVTWTALTDTLTRNVLVGGQHYYLTKSLTYTGTKTSFIAGPAAGGDVACLHLNGYDITATNTYAFYAGSGTMNVMGSGTVTGKAHADYRYGGALVCNTTNKNSTVNLYSGTYKSSADSVSHTDGTTAFVLTIRNNGGKLNLYEDVTVEGTGTGSAIYVGTSKQGKSNLSLKGATIKGNVLVRERNNETYTTNITADSAKITGTMEIESENVNAVILRGKPVIGQLTVPSGFLVTLEDLQKGTNVKVSADGVFTEANENAQLWDEYFTAADETKWVVVQNKALAVTEKTTLANGKKVIFIGNSMTYYGKCVIEKGQTVYSQEARTNGQGYFYQICKANGVDVSVTNFTFGGHGLQDFYSGSCAADRGHNGYNHLNDLIDRSYDYVVLQEGSRNKSKTDILNQLQPMMDIFLESNPETKFVFLAQHLVHSNNYAWRSTMKGLEEAGVTVVDWGALVNDVMTGAAAVPGATETYSKFSFIVNKSADDGYHPNVLTGYITAQMLYSAITGEQAEGQDYSFWNDPNANAAFDMDAYKETYYAYDATAPSNTNFEAIFGSTADMTGLQQLVDQYLAAKGYRDYE